MTFGDIKLKLTYMDDGESNQDLETNIHRKFINKISNAGNVLQSIWIRCSTILSYNHDRKFILRKCNFILRVGTIFWIIFFISQII